MPTVPLPENASLEHLRKQAKLVRQLVASGDEGALGLLREFHPRFADASPSAPPAGFKPADAQLTVARLYGLPSAVTTNLRSVLTVLSAAGCVLGLALRIGVGLRPAALPAT